MDKDKKNAFHEPSCDGNTAKDLARAASYDEVQIGPDGKEVTVRKGWLHEYFENYEDIWLRGQVEVWRQWQAIVKDGRDAHPSPEAVRTFGHKTRRLFRLARMTMTDTKLSFYLHALAAHGGQYMRALGSLGRYMNEGVECNHKKTWQLFLHTSKGGGGGRIGGQQENGQRKILQRRAPSVTEQVMKRQSVMIFDELKDLWDERTYKNAGVRTPSEGEDGWTECLVQDSDAVQAKRRAEREQQAEYRATKKQKTGGKAGGHTGGE